MGKQKEELEAKIRVNESNEMVNGAKDCGRTYWCRRTLGLDDHHPDRVYSKEVAMVSGFENWITTVGCDGTRAR